jgi:hypothetical protein
MIGPSVHLSALYLELAIPELAVIFHPRFSSPVHYMLFKLLFRILNRHSIRIYCG